MKNGKDQNIKEKNKNSFRLDKVVSFLSWIVSILVSLSVGAGMATGILNLKVIFIPLVVTIVTGWIVIIFTILSIVFRFFE
ncbi:MAG: hypothetical protein QXX68_01630 [Candidatus Pacearchaeota archaeon]